MPLLRTGRPVAAAVAALLLIAGAAFAGNAMLSPRSASSDGPGLAAPAAPTSPDAFQLSGADESAEPTESAEPAESAEPTESAEPAESAEPTESAEPGDDSGVDESDDAGDSSTVDQGSHDGSDDGPSASQSTDDGSGHD